MALTVKAFLSKESNEKTIHLIKHVSLFALVWGFLGLFIGLIGAFDAMSSVNDISTGVLAAGLKIGLLSPSFGIVVFLIARLGIIALTLTKK